MSQPLIDSSRFVVLSDLFGVDALHALTWSLVHSLWQAGLVSLCLVAFIGLTKKSQAALRYKIYALGIFSCFALNVATFFSYFQKSVLTLSFSTQGRVATYIPIAPETNLVAFFSSYVNQYLSQIVFCWSLGFILIGGKNTWNWFFDQRHIKRKMTMLPDHWENQFLSLADSIGLRRIVRFRLSEKNTVPCVLGYFKPVVLLPASLLLGMSPQQIEVIVLHELAHIKRLDVLLANLQSVLKALYFFNPFVFWISAKLDQERENACDDIAVGICSNPLLYAKTLQQFAEMHTHFLTTTTAFTGRKNMLLPRIQRLFSTEKNYANRVHRTISAALLLSMGITTAAYSWIQIGNSDTVNLSGKNLPLKQLLQNAESACPGSTAKVKLRQPDMNVNVNFSNVACADVAAVFGDMEERFGMKFTDVQFDAALTIFKQQCPTVFRNVTLKHPTALYSSNMMDVTCLDILGAVAEFDAKLK
ncbi:M56 family metallopeptidase [Undibacterium sp. Di24W]|uniref:M56 family metallopeptidase n=1 Tax=Undibacterium sp. Di24W TaxID=3413033 RepID=UPI003BF12DB8